MRDIVFGIHGELGPMIAAAIDVKRYRPWFARLDGVDLARVDAAVPLRFDDYDALRRATRPPHRRHIMPAPELVALCDDKPALSARLGQLGFRRHLPAIHREGDVRYPCILKPVRGAFGEGCRVLRSAADDGPAPGCFRQALVAGEEEFAVHLLRAGGRLHYVGAVRYRMGGPAEIRSAANRPVAADPAAPADGIALSAAILDALDYEGTACVNYKMADGVPMLLEVNPRFGSSLVWDLNRYLDAYLAALAA